LIQLVRQSNGLVLGLHLLSRVLIQSAFPEAVGATTIFIDAPTWADFRKTHGDFAALVRWFAPSLTGLTGEQLTALGYAVIDVDTEETLVFVAPAEALPSRDGISPANGEGVESAPRAADGSSPACLARP
jgi:hypothetical protein